MTMTFCTCVNVHDHDCLSNSHPLLSGLVLFPGREGGEKQPGNEAMPRKAHSSRGLKVSTVDGKTLLGELLVGSQ